MGYGAQPDECVALATEVCDRTLAGNHDLVVTGDIDIADFSSAAAAAAAWTRENIGSEALDFLQALRPRGRGARGGALPREPARPRLGVRALHLAGRGVPPADGPAVGAIGHSHVALWFREDGRGAVAGAQAAPDSDADLSEGRWLLNPGGVGQPRDGDPRAAWLLLDTEAWTATWRRVEYPIERAAKAIEDAGLPPVLGERLYTGQ